MASINNVLDHASAHPGWALGTLAASAVAAYVILKAQRLYSHRRIFKKLEAQGVPIMTHSWWTGHLHILRDYAAAHPPDLNPFLLEHWLAQNRKKYFPHLNLPEDADDSQLPPVLYLDLYPLSTLPQAIICDPAMATQFVGPQPHAIGGVTRGPLQKTLFQTLTNERDIFCMEGAEWKSWRTRLNPAFSNRNITALIPEMIDEIEVFAQELEKMTGKSGDDGWSDVFQMASRTSALTVDVIGRALIDRRLHDQTLPKGGSPVKKALLETIMMVKRPKGRWRHWLPRKLVYKLDYLLIAQKHAVMDEVFAPGLEAAIDNVNLASKQGADLTKAHNGSGSAKKTLAETACTAFNTDKKGLIVQDPETRNVVLNNLKILMLAGYDTTASTLCWVFKAMLDNPECLKTLREEHDRVLGRPDDDDDSDYVSSAATALRASPQLLNDLPYTMAVIKETLRLHPIGSILRQNEANTPTGALKLVHRPTGQVYPTTGFATFDGSPHYQLSDKYWPRANEFLPERWLISGSHEKDHPLQPRYEGSPAELYRAFGFGPRGCIGKELAYTELKLAAALVMRRFDVREAWEAWDVLRNQVDKPKSMLDGQRLYPVSVGPAHLKDDMPVQVRLAQW